MYWAFSDTLAGAHAYTVWKDWRRKNPNASLEEVGGVLRAFSYLRVWVQHALCTLFHFSPDRKHNGAKTSGCLCSGSLKLMTLFDKSKAAYMSTTYEWQHFEVTFQRSIHRKPHYKDPRQKSARTVYEEDEEANLWDGLQYPGDSSMCFWFFSEKAYLNIVSGSDDEDEDMDAEDDVGYCGVDNQERRIMLVWVTLHSALTFQFTWIGETGTKSNCNPSLWYTSTPPPIGLNNRQCLNELNFTISHCNEDWVHWLRLAWKPLQYRTQLPRCRPTGVATFSHSGLFIYHPLGQCERGLSYQSNTVHFTLQAGQSCQEIEQQVLWHPPSMSWLSQNV